MRIVAGRFRGHRLAPVPRRGVRPTADPVREALFNVLGDEVVGRPFLDLAAGTGAVGLEAFSRGAEPVLLVEKDRAALAVLRRNLDLLRVADDPRLSVRAVDAGRFLSRGWDGPPLGVAYVDPPYGERALPRWLAALAAGAWLDGDSLVVVEHRSGDEVAAPGLEPLWTRRYGDSSLTAFSRA